MREKRRSRLFFRIFIWFFIPAFILGTLSICLLYFSDIDLGLGFGKKFVRANARQVGLSDFERVLRKENISYSSISYYTDGISIAVVLTGDTKVIFSDTKDVAYQVSSLQELLLRLTINKVENIRGGSVDSNGARAKIIDFRYSKPIVKF